MRLGSGKISLRVARLQPPLAVARAGSNHLRLTMERAVRITYQGGNLACMHNIIRQPACPSPNHREAPGYPQGYHTRSCSKVLLYLRTDAPLQVVSHSRLCENLTRY